MTFSVTVSPCSRLMGPSPLTPVSDVVLYVTPDMCREVRCQKAHTNSDLTVLKVVVQPEIGDESDLEAQMQVDQTGYENKSDYLCSNE